MCDDLPVFSRLSHFQVAPSYQPVESRRRFDTDELFTKRLQRHNHRESNDHTMARRTSLQAILKPPTRHTHNKPRRIRHIRCKILLEGRKTIKWMLRKVAAMMAPLIEPFKLERNSPYNTVVDLFRWIRYYSIICNFFLTLLCELKVRFYNNIIFCFKKIFEWN